MSLFQFKCFDMSKEQQCLLLNSFLEDCTNEILGNLTGLYDKQEI